MNQASRRPSTGRPRARWLVLAAWVLAVAIGLTLGARALIGRGEQPLSQPVLSAPPPLRTTPTPPAEPDFGTSATPVTFPAVVADQQPRPSTLPDGWTILPGEPELFSAAAPVVYADGGVGTLMVLVQRAPAGTTGLGRSMSWTTNRGSVVCGRHLTQDVLLCAFRTADDGLLVVQGRGTTLDAIARATQDLQSRLPAS
ncbi:hypothetical protein [Aestuariimicrobium kwangyangense]|uniref:hypothetical protein n=1 Tax=Aestuariimicrobium kwangyangense TaxID=396389 RepID=UPI0012F82CFF|nr:hypothetical protein [Aestuariimicrobium kwangyangense]